MIKDEKEVIVDVDKGIRIIVDATPKVIPLDELSPDREITYEQVVSLSSKSVPSGPNIDVEVEYSNAIARPTRRIFGQRRERKDSRWNSLRCRNH